MIKFIREFLFLSLEELLFDPLSKERERIKEFSSYFFSFTVPLTVVYYHRRSSIEQNRYLTGEHDSPRKPKRPCSNMVPWFRRALVPRRSWRVKDGPRGGGGGGGGGGQVRSSRGQEGEGRVKFDERREEGKGKSGVDLEDRKGGSFRSIGFPDCHWEAPPFHRGRRTILETVVVPQIILLSTSYSSICFSRRFFLFSFFFFEMLPRLVSFQGYDFVAWVSELQEISIEVKIIRDFFRLRDGCLLF